MLVKERNQLITRLKHEGYIKSLAVEHTFQLIPRELFIPDSIRHRAYVDTPLEIGEGQTISAPHMVAIMCEALDIHKGQKILEIGAGSGYHAAVVATLVGNNGHVYSIERFSMLAEQARVHLKKAGVSNVTVVVGDGSLGYPEQASYDRIYLTCASPGVPPPLFAQLKDKGKLLIPNGDRICTLERYEKNKSKITRTNHGGCVFVPLVGKYGF
ncbi:MAG: protein-L-isoaspartate O-methyltransferase [Euryarchaeota archaeon]|nr:protein-L-isoaspartate O-methyltransferase [Euryarchaeota archaeon]